MRSTAAVRVRPVHAVHVLHAVQSFLLMASPRPQRDIGHRVSAGGMAQAVSAVQVYHCT
jgi:hypothetical protein